MNFPLVDLGQIVVRSGVIYDYNEDDQMVAQRPWTGPSTSNLDSEIRQGLRDLQVLAYIYEQRGNQKQADEVRLAIKQIEEQIAARDARPRRSGN